VIRFQTAIFFREDSTHDRSELARSRDPIPREGECAVVTPGSSNPFSARGHYRIRVR
jgi:hypothetical protein